MNRHVATLCLLLLAPAVMAQPAGGVRHVELVADEPGGHPVRLCPGATTTLLFDTAVEVETVRLEGRERFEVVAWGGGGRVLTLLLKGDAKAGESLGLWARFQDREAPEAAHFRLVVEAAGDTLVRVFRRPRSAESYREELRVERRRRVEAEEQNVRLRASQESGEDGLLGLVTSDWVHGKGVSFADIGLELAPGETNTLEPRMVWSYRGNGRVVLEVRLYNPPGAPPWQSVEVELTAPDGTALRVVRLLQPEPIGADEERTVRVEAEAPAEGAKGPWTLHLRAAPGAPAQTWRGVRFP